MSAPVRPTCAPTSPRARASTARTTAARRGISSDSPTPSRSAAFGWIRTTPTSHGSPRSVTRTVRTPSAAKRVYAVVDADSGGLYRSDDGGAHWRRTSSDSRIWQRGWYFAGVTVEPRDADVLYVCNTTMLRSTDGGTTFVPVEGDDTG